MTTILVIEDEETVLGLEKDILTGANYKVLLARTGTEALKILETVKPDLLLIDIMMPEMTGVDFAKRVRSNPALKDIKMIFISALNLADAGRDELRKLNISDFIEKPFTVKLLLERIKKALAGEKREF